MRNSLLVILMVFTLFGCKKNPDNAVQPELPAISTVAATAVYNTTAVSGGIITNDGGADITARGVCWSTDHDPVITNDHTSDNTGTGTFSSAITGLQPSTTYYVRAYASNSIGTVYGNEVTVTTLDHNIYCGGSVLSGGFPAHTIATIWKNGVATSLTDATHDAYVNCIQVVNTDVYAGGIEHNGTHWVAKMWKNGVVTTLTDGSSEASVLSIYVAGPDVYIGGSEGADAKIWKNAIGTALIGGTFINSVYVAGTNVYACGDYYNYPLSYAQVWKNGVLTELTDRTLNSDANTIFVSGPDVYVGGRENLVAKIWKNTVPASLSDGTNFNWISTLLVDGADVYAGGYESLTPGGTFVARYWKNGAVNILTDGTDSNLNSIFLFGPDLYICGINIETIKIWKNGTPIIFDIDANSVSVRAIYLN